MKTEIKTEIKTLDLMLNQLIKKYGNIIEDISIDDYYDIYLKEGYIFNETGCRTLIESNLKDIRKSLKYGITKEKPKIKKDIQISIYDLGIEELWP